MYVHKKPDLLTKNKNRLTSGDNEFQCTFCVLKFNYIFRTPLFGVHEMVHVDREFCAVSNES